MTQRDILYCPSIFSDPYTFKPERWFVAEASKRLDKYLVAFARGAREYIRKQ
jgi:hypothetical protein